VPEGHTIHRTARLQRRILRGRQVRADSPQGRFAGGAALLDGQRCTGIEAYGKHLFYRWSEGDTLHVHLGLYGKFRVYERGAASEPTAGTRLRLTTDEHVLHLAGPTACDLVDPQQERRIVERLGPDPLRRDADPERAWAALRRRTIPISAALLDQKIVSGIGNVYRAEVLFTNGISPFRTARDLDRPTFDRVWATMVGMLRDGERAGRILTVDPADVGVRTRSRVPASERVYVYKRTGLPCRRCGTSICSGESALRTIFWCPWHQPE
jgi:endonuclease VIII